MCVCICVRRPWWLGDILYKRGFTRFYTEGALHSSCTEGGMQRPKGLCTHICTFRSFFLQIWGWFTKTLGVLRGFAKALNRGCYVKPLYREGFTKPLYRGGLYAHFGLFSYRYASWSPYRRVMGSFAKVLNKGGLCRAPMHRVFCEASFYFCWELCEKWGLIPKKKTILCQEWNKCRDLHQKSFFQPLIPMGCGGDGVRYQKILGGIAWNVQICIQISRM